ncbi:hypothetical protein FACS1894156_0590 [Bacteroidia bacterium]|nr:hypothetical protein FACS1894156_0590 [Bacteroidia bacterium]
MDDAWNYSMWVEVYNAGTAAVNQRDYYFTDDPAVPQKWRPASKSIAAGGYSVLYFEREDRTGHAAFKLEPEGGTLYLTKNNEVVDQITYPAQYRNASYGRRVDGGAEWVFFAQSSPNAGNAGKSIANQLCAKPVFSKAGGFYSGTQKITFAAPAAGETIYYTTNGAEPTEKSTRYTGQEISITQTTCLRAAAFAPQSLPSGITTATYFINYRNINLPIVSIVTEQKNLTDNTIGIYVEGTNGIPGPCDESPKNYFQDWDRPANFEIFDVNKTLQLSQEVDIGIAGNCSMGNPQKSLKIQPRKKLGVNRLGYDFFPNKKGNPYKDIQLRNSGNDFWYTMMRDAFLQTLIIGRMDIDYLAYEPAVCFMNGEYYGVQNLRERSNKDYLFSNYGLDEEDFYLYEPWEMQYNAPFKSMVDYAKNNNIASAAVYDSVSKLIDIDNLVSYVVSELYYGNQDAINADWGTNNIKGWKKINGGKWRFILYDTDYSFNIYNERPASHNALQPFMTTGDWFGKMFQRFMVNPDFKNKFIRRFCVQLSSTFAPQRVDSIMAAMAARIAPEIPYHKQRWAASGYWSNFTDEIAKMKTYADARPNAVYGHLRSQFFSGLSSNDYLKYIRLSSNIGAASYHFFDEPIIDDNINLRYFKNQPVKVVANNVQGYTFTKWEVAHNGVPQADVSTDTFLLEALSTDISLQAIYTATAAATPKRIFVNEMSGNNKWLEIYNDENEAVDLTDYIIQKIDEDSKTADWKIPAGTSIAAKGFLSWEQDSKNADGSTFTWGISPKKDVAFKIFDNNGVELDYFEVRSNLYSDGGGKTVGRKPDGGALLVIFEQGTRDATNFVEPAHKKLYINEMSGNDKWLEIYNDEDTEVDLTDYIIQKIDEDGKPADWTIPAGTIISAKGFLSWEQDSKNADGSTFTWGISAKKDVAFKIFDNNNVELDYFEVRSNLYSDGGGKTVGRTPDGGTQLVVFEQGTRDASNGIIAPPDPPTPPSPPVVTSSVKLYINEISGNDKWLEIYNAEDAARDLTGYIIRKIDEDGKPTDWAIPAGTSIAAKGFLSWTQNEPNSFTWGISASKDVAFVIIDNEGDTTDYFEVRSPLYSSGNGKTVGRATDGGTPLVVFLSGTKNKSNTLPSNDIALSSLVVSAGNLDPAFAPATTTYTVNAGGGVSSASVTAAARHAAATVAGNVTDAALQIGATTTVAIVVTAEDGVTTQTYTVNIYRKSNDATLQNLTVSLGALSPAFSSGVTDYTVNVNNNITTIGITGTANHSKASVAGNTTQRPLSVGNNAIALTVTAEDGTQKTYTITVIRAIATAVETSNAEPLQVYPNPVTNGELRVENGELNAGDKIEIYNVNGTKVFETSLSIVHYPVSIDISHLPAGVYIVKVGNKVGKVVKQ